MNENQLQQNRKRAYKIYKNRGNNIELGKEVVKIREKMSIEDGLTEEIVKYCNRLFGCGSNGLYRTHGDAATFIHALRCKHKLCFICNAERKRKLRSVYIKFFEDNPHLLEDFNFMHLTLTVPHTTAGWKDKQVYNSEILKAFKDMRNKHPFWKEMVYGGQYSVEITKNKNGLHIHIHSLILVPKAISRNELYVEILKGWNKETVWTGANGAWSPERKAGIEKSLLCLRNWERIDKVVAKLNPKGSTLVGLESVYYYEKDSAGKLKKNYGQGSEGIIRGVMECLKYHFEPVALKDANLIVELLPALKNQRLYGRFGAFYKDKGLSLAMEKIEDDTGLDEGREIIHPESGLQSEDYEYKIFDTSKVKSRKRESGYTVPVCCGEPKHIFDVYDFRSVLVAFGEINKQILIDRNTDVKIKIEYMKRLHASQNKV